MKNGQKEKLEEELKESQENSKNLQTQLDHKAEEFTRLQNESTEQLQLKQDQINRSAITPLRPKLFSF